MQVSNATSTASQTIVENPQSKLGGQDFLQLFLTELKYQDPTEPMDNEKMLTQTAQLATLESNEELKSTLEKMTNQMSSTANFGAVSAIGKMANTGQDSVYIEDGSGSNFSLYFKDDISSGQVTISDRFGKVIDTIDLDSYQNRSGNLQFYWDATDSAGNIVSNDSYSIKANYVTVNGESKSTAYGTYPIESVKFDGG